MSAPLPPMTFSMPVMVSVPVSALLAVPVARLTVAAAAVAARL
jgi:hypothetical protein